MQVGNGETQKSFSIIAATAAGNWGAAEPGRPGGLVLARKPVGLVNSALQGVGEVGLTALRETLGLPPLTLCLG